MIKQTNSKGDINSDVLYFLVGLVLVVIGLFLLFSISNKEKENNFQEISGLKEGYQTIQLARTFIQTPLKFEDKTKSVAEWVNNYFLLTDDNKKSELRRAIMDLASKTIKPQLQTGHFNSEAKFTYYVFGKKTAVFTVANSWKQDGLGNSNNIIYSGTFQEDIAIQLPVYISGSQFNPADRKILFEIKKIESGQNKNKVEVED